MRQLDDEIGAILVEQLGDELYNHNVYKSFANYFYSLGIMKLYEYYEHRAKEEYNHHKWVLTYLNDTRFTFAYPEVPAVSLTYVDPVDPFKLTIKLEEDTTNHIHKIADLAKEKKDWQTVTFLQTDLIPEQTEEERTSVLAYQIMLEDTDLLTKSDKVYELIKNA